MKAIYINIDPYLAAFAAWIKGGQSGPAPSGPSIPLAVTVPLGQEVAILCPGTGDVETEPSPAATPTIDGVGVGFIDYGPGGNGIPADALDTNVVPKLSALAPSAKYYIIAATGDSVTCTVQLFDTETAEIKLNLSFTVLVRREQASGPVDLVDFTPPAAAPSAADIKSALVAAGDEALAGVSLGGAIADGVLARVSPDSGPIPLSLSGENTYTLGAASS